MESALELARAAWPTSAWLVVSALGISFVAGMVRGFSGFGYSALVVAALAPFVFPAPVVLAVLLLEVLASAPQMRAVARDVDGKWCRSILAGNLVFVPIGVMGLLWLKPDAARVAVSGLTLLGALGMRLTLARPLSPSRLVHASAGSVSGVLNGFAASGGIVAALLMAASGVPPRALRSTMITVLLWISAYAVIWAVVLSLGRASELRGMQVLGWALLFWPPMLAGIRVGGRAFERTAAHRQARIVLDILILTAGCGLAASLWRWNA